MTDARDDLDGPLDPEDTNSGPAANEYRSASADLEGGPDDTPIDPNDEIPVPIAMWPSEIDERGQVVEALRGHGPPPRTDTQVDPT